MSSPKKKKKQAIAPVSANNAVLRAVEEAKKRQDAVRSLFGDEIIAPVGQQVSSTPTSTQTQDNELLSVFNKWLESQKNNISSAGEAIANTFSPVAKAFGQNDTEAWYRDYIDPKRFDDGYDFGDVTMSILGTGVDAAADFAAGTGEAVESILDGMSFGGMKLAEYLGAKYLFRLEDAILNQITGNNYSYMEDRWDETQKETVDFVRSDFIPTDQIQEAAKQGLGYDWEQDSVLGEKSDALVQSVPPIVASLIAQSHGVPWWLVSYANAFGGKSEQALNEGATTDEAFINAAITAFGEIATEKISSGILPGGGKSLDDIVTKTISKIPNKTARGFVKFFIDGLGEGLEEVLSEDISTIADGVTHKRDGDLWEMLFSEEAVKRKAEAALGGFILGGGSNVINTVKTSRQGRDTVTGLTANEETVVKAETERRAAEHKADGKKANIDKIRDEVIEAMKRGDISLEAIESSLGGEVYRRYTEAKTKQKGIQEELKRAAATIDALYGKGDLTEQEQADLDKAVQSIGNLSAQEKALKVDDARQNLHEYVNNLTKTQGDAYLRGRYEGFNTDKVYRAKNKKNQAAVDATIESAKKAGLNNTRRVHDLVDFAAKISADTGLVFNLSNSKRIKDAFVQRQTADIQKLEAIPEAERTAAQKKTLEEMRELLAKVKSGDITINGTNSGNMITLNLGSPDPLNRIAGHEISHSLENAKAYDALRDSLLAYAKSKGVDTDKMLGEYRKRYQGANNADAEREMIADMVGDYLFSDENFVKHLTKNRNLFQRVYDEIKYLLKLATTGSQEARELERVKHLFDKAYKQLAKQKRDEVVREVVGDDIAPVSYSLSENPQKVDADYIDAVNRGDMETAQRLVDEAAKKAGFPVRLLHGTQKFGFTVPDTSMSDDKLSFFATNEVDTAKTYSSLPGKRRIAEDANYDDIESENEALDEAARDGAYDLAHAISSWAGYYGAADADFIYDEFDRIANAGDGVAITGTADGDMYEVADEIIANLYDEDLHDGMEFWEWQETDEGEDLYTKVNKTIAKFLAKYEFDTNAQRSGNYDLYANTDGLLVIEGNGAKWDDIKSDILPDITSDEGKKYGYRGHWDKWTTRSISKYASDNGYRGVLFKNIYDDGGRASSGVRKPADVYSFFYPQEQVKSADPVTYDDSGNVIPLSQRFNPNNNDIRYSLSDSTAPLAPMNNFDTFGKDLKREGYSSDTAPVKAEARQNIAPVQYSMTDNGEQKPVVDHIREKMEKDLANLRERYEPQIEKYKGMADSKEETIGKLAWQLLSELQTMEKGKKVSWDLGYLLDHTVKEPADYRSLDIALKNIRDNPLEVVNPRSKAERFARQMLERQWQEMLDYASDLEQEYRQSIEDLATQANQELDSAAGKPVAPIAQNRPAGSDVAPVAPTSQEVTEEKKAPTINRVMANDGPKAKQKKGSLTMKLRNTLVDKGSVIDDISIKTGNPELIARYKSINNAAAKAQHMIGNGDAKAGVKALTEIQKNVKKVASEAEFDDYMYNRLNVDRMTMMTRYPGRHDIPVFGPEYSAAESRANVQAYEAKHPEFRGLANDVYAFVRNNLNLMIQEGLITQETAKLWGEMYPHYIPIERASFQDKHTHQDGRTGAYNPVKKLTGSEKELRPMFTAIADQTIAVQKAIAKNRFGKELRRMLNGVEARETASTGPVDGILQDGTIVYSDARGINGKVTGYDESRNQYSVQFKYDNGRTEEVWMNPDQVSQMAPDTAMDEAMRGFFDSKDLLKPAKGEENPIFTVFENGKRIEFEITPDIYDALKPTSDAMSAKIPVLSQLTNARKRILTDLNPVFWLTNTPKDIQAILPNSKHPGATYGNLPNAMLQIASKGKWYMEYVENGGKQQSYFNEEERSLEKEPGTAKRILTGPARFIRSINESLEMMPRLAEYIASRKKGASIDVAMLDAARVTTDFSAAGDFSRMLNRNFVPFLTASISGSAQQVRNFREAKAKGAKGIAGYIMRQAIATIPLAVFNHLMWEDDEEYAEISDYVKQNYYIVGKTDDGKFIRIPKGREVAVIQDFYEQMANLVTGNFDDVDIGSFAQLAMTNIAPNNPIDNNILAPIIQAHSGKTWYGDDLIPSRLQKVPNAEQYDESTDAISKWIGEMTGMSPYRINYILDQYSGGFGDVILPMLTSEAESGSDTIGGKLLAPLADKFTVDSTMKNQYVSDFYDKVDELEINSNSQNATDEDILMSAYMNGRYSAISDLHGLRRKVNSAVTVGDLQDIAEELKPFLDSSTDPGLWYALNYGNQNTKITDSSKYQIVRSIQRLIDDRAKKALETYQNVSIDGGYANVGTDHYLKKDDKWSKLSSEQVEEQKLMTNVLGIKPEMYWNSKAAFSSFKNDKDANGNTIKGSREDKVIDWINSQDMPYEAKIILYKSQYTGDHTYDAEIIEYLQSNPNITYDQMVTILKDLKLM